MGILSVAYRIVSLFHKMSGGHFKFMDYEVDMQKDILDRLPFEVEI